MYQFKGENVNKIKSKEKYYFALIFSLKLFNNPIYTILFY